MRLLSLNLNALLKSIFQDIAAWQRHLISIGDSVRSNRTKVSEFIICEVMLLSDLKPLLWRRRSGDFIISDIILDPWNSCPISRSSTNQAKIELTQMVIFISKPSWYAMHHILWYNLFDKQIVTKWSDSYSRCSFGNVDNELCHPTIYKCLVQLWQCIFQLEYCHILPACFGWWGHNEGLSGVEHHQDLYCNR